MNLGEPIAIGNTATIYLLDNKIIKIFNDSLPETEALYESRKQKLACSYGLPVPEIFDVTTVNERQAIIMEYIKGQTLGDMLLKEPEQAEKYMIILVDLQLKIHDIKAEGHHSMIERLSKQIKSVKLLGNKYKEILLRKLYSMPLDKKLCHGDFHMFNIIMNSEKPIIIDWVDSSDGNICADVYRSYLLYLQFSSELAELYLNLYSEKSNIDKKEILVWAPIIAGASLSENLSYEKASFLINIVQENCRLEYRM